MSRSNPKLLAALALALLASACAGPQIAPPRRLLLSYEGPAPAPAQSELARPRLVVRAVTVPDYLDRRQLVYRAEAAELRHYEQVEWAERPAKAVTRWLTQALAARRGDYTVLALTTPDGRAPDATLSLSLDAFEPGRDGVLRLRGSWAYARHAEAASLSGRFDADVPTAATTPEASVAAMQQALQQAFERLVVALPAATQGEGA
jgi:uncharacterized lipoprotein YmbA